MVTPTSPTSESRPAGMRRRRCTLFLGSRVKFTNMLAWPWPPRRPRNVGLSYIPAPSRDARRANWPPYAPLATGFPLRAPACRVHEGTVNRPGHANVRKVSEVFTFADGTSSRRYANIA